MGRRTAFRQNHRHAQTGGLPRQTGTPGGRRRGPQNRQTAGRPRAGLRGRRRPVEPGMRRAETAPCRHRVFPQAQRQAGYRGRRGHHRVPVIDANRAARFRWLLLAVFVLSSAINYLDRQALATLAPLVRAEFHLSRAEYGWILGVFSITYALSAPLAGMLTDRIGLNRAASLAIGVWSCAGIATGFTRGLGSLIGCRAVLGAAEAGGIPAAGKAIHLYLRPPERALGNAVNQAGVSLGAILAPPLATWIALRSGWRHAFIFTGILGLVWIPVWNWAARRVPAAAAPAPAQTGAAHILRDRRMWAFVSANALSMVGYSLWTNWTTQYLVDAHSLTIRQAAWYAWIPPFVAMSGGFAGGWLSLRRRRSEEHTSELQSPCNLVCRLLLEKKKKTKHTTTPYSPLHSCPKICT